MVLTEVMLRSLADGGAWQRGVAYYAEGRVRSIVRDGDTVVAAVEGQEPYCVRLTLLEDRLWANCSCPVGEDGTFCKHCVAVGLALIAGGQGGGPLDDRRVLADSDRFSRDVERIRTHLGAKDRSALVDMIVEQALSDDLLWQRLRVETAIDAKPIDRQAVRAAITAATRTRGFIHYREAGWFAQGIQQVVGRLAGLLERGFAEDVIPLTEHALRRVERAIEHMDDSDGHMRPILDDLQTLHHAACLKAKPDPIALARRLFEWETTGEWDVFFGAAKTYADVFGDAGLAEYRRLAEAAWEKIPFLGPGDDRRSFESNRFRITHAMETLAAQSGDLAALIEVKRRDLSSAYRFMEIAESYKEAGASDEALAWAEKGFAAFPNHTDSRLLRFLADAYRRAGREDDALQITWRGFVDRCHDLDEYQRLKAQAERMGVWPAWRDRALEHLRADRQSGRDTRLRSEWTAGPANAGSSLVAVLLWENELDAAWEEACTAGCSMEQWLGLARRREADHPEDAVRIYHDYVVHLVNQTNNASYKEAAGFVLAIRDLLRAAGDEERFPAYLSGLRQTFKAKRNFMKLLAAL